MTKYYSSKETCLILGVCRKTLINWANTCKIDFIRTVGGWRKYNIDKFLITNDNLNNKPKIKVCYCRVSTYEQKSDLVRQVDYLKEKYPEHEIITDVGSGINFKRKGFLKLLSYAIENKLNEVVISYKDRLCRIGYDLVEYIIKNYSNAKIIIENNETKLPAQEITEDLIEIITVYSSKLYGTRNYKKE